MKQMIIAIIKLNALPEKCLELKQSLAALVDPMRKEKGCLSHDTYQDIENDNAFSLIQIWQTRENLDDFLQSELFAVLIGTSYLLSRPAEITMNEVAHSSRLGITEAVRK
jgi:quinol monooxygenase YgiN